MTTDLTPREYEILANALSMYETTLLSNALRAEVRTLLVKMVRAFDATQGVTPR